MIGIGLIGIVALYAMVQQLQDDKASDWLILIITILAGIATGGVLFAIAHRLGAL